MNARAWIVIFGLALLLRAGWGTFQLIRADDPSALAFPDEEQYWLIAGSLQAGDGLRDELGFRATRMPLYPAILSLFAGTSYGVVAAKGLHWLVGAAVAALTAGLATVLVDRRVGLTAGFLVAIDPFLVFVSSLLLTETFFMVALVILWWATARMLDRDGDRTPVGRWLGIGLAAALAVYLRESSLGLMVILLAFVVCCRRFNRRVLLGAVLAGGIVIVSLFPWAARNRDVTGDWCWLTHRGGISLYDGVRPGADGSSDLADVKQTPAVRGLNEVEWNSYFLGESMKIIWEEPGRVLRLAGVKLARIWNPFPNVETYQSPLLRGVSAFWTLPIFAFAVVGAILLGKPRSGVGLRAALYLLLPVFYLSALHSLFVGSIRYRLVAMPMLETLAAVTLVTLIDRFRQHRLDGGVTVGH